MEIQSWNREDCCNIGDIWKYTCDSEFLSNGGTKTVVLLGFKWLTSVSLYTNGKELFCVFKGGKGGESIKRVQ